MGRLMMEHLLERARAAGLGGTRLVQAAYNTRSLSLYIKLGFEVRELLACLHGNPIARRMRNCPVRLGEHGDMEMCNGLCQRLHGYARTEDVAEALTAAIAHRGGAGGADHGLLDGRPFSRAHGGGDQ